MAARIGKLGGHPKKPEDAASQEADSYSISGRNRRRRLTLLPDSVNTPSPV
jgi:hypothetical protein